MKITINSVHFSAADRLRDYIEKRMNKLDRFFDRVVDARVNLKLQQEVKGANKSVEIALHVPGNTLIAQVQSSTFEHATNQAIEKIKSQLKKHKEKLEAR